MENNMKGTIIDGQTGTGTEPEQKTGFISKAIQLRNRIMATKAGKILVRGGEIALGVFTLKKTYDYGMKKGAESVDPVYIYVDKDPKPEEATTDDTTSEETEEQEEETEE